MTDHSTKPKRISEGAEVLDDAEINRRLAALSPADCWRLERTAAIYADGTGWSPTDLLQEAFLAALDRRQWRKDLDARHFLVGTMRSLVFSRRKARRVDALDAAMREDAETVAGAFEDLTDANNHPERHATDREESEDFLARLEALFADDAQALRVLRGRAVDEEAASIRRALGVNESQYETICRRLLRRYQKSIKAERNE